MRLIRTTIKLDLQLLSFPLLQEPLLYTFFQGINGLEIALIHVNEEQQYATVYFHKKLTLKMFYSIPGVHSNLLFTFKNNQLLSKLILLPPVVTKDQLEEIIEETDRISETGFILCMVHDLILHPLRREKISALGISYNWLKDQIARSLGIILQAKTKNNLVYALNTYPHIQTQTQFTEAFSK